MHVNYKGICDAIDTMECLGFSDVEIAETKNEILILISNELFKIFSDPSNDTVLSKKDIGNFVNAMAFLNEKVDYKKKLVDKIQKLDTDQCKTMLKELDKL